MKTDGDRIKALMGDRNQAAFAREFKIPGGPSMLSQHISGNRPVSVEAAIAYARGFGVALAAVSPDAERLVRSAIGALGPAVSASTKKPPDLAQALALVLDAIAAAPDRAKLRTALQAIVEDDSPAYRQRLAELLAPAPSAAPAAPPAAPPAVPAIGAHRTNEGSVPFKWKASDQAQTPGVVVPPES